MEIILFDSTDELRPRTCDKPSLSDDINASQRPLSTQAFILTLSCSEHRQNTKWSKLKQTTENVSFSTPSGHKKASSEFSIIFAQKYFQVFNFPLD